MIILGVDTGSRVGSLAVRRDAELVGEWAESGNEPYSSRLCGNAAALLSSIDLSLAEVDVFAVSAGPGSFTGLRIGLTAVKAWAEILCKPIVPVSGLAAVAADALDRSIADEATIVPVLDARR